MKSKRLLKSSVSFVVQVRSAIELLIFVTKHYAANLLRITSKDYNEVITDNVFDVETLPTL